MSLNLFDLLNEGGGIDLSSLDNSAVADSNIPTFDPPQTSEFNGIRFNLNGNDISLDMKGNFSGINPSGEIIRGDDLKEEVKKALEEGYFQVLGFDTVTINKIDEAVYGGKVDKHPTKK